MSTTQTISGQAVSERMVCLPEQALLTFTGMLRQSSDPQVQAAAQQLYNAVKKSRIKT